MLSAVQALEESNSVAATPEGRWALLFSTQLDAPTTSRPGANLLQPLIDLTYSLFFKVAPALAGAQQDGGGGASNEQCLFLDTGIVENRVRLPLPFNVGEASTLEIRVDGEVSREEESRLKVTFTSCSFALPERGSRDSDTSGMIIRVPLPRPVGVLQTTYCDDELRISRGSRGGIFVLKRQRSP